MTEIIMPQVGQDIPTAIITEWLKAEGDEVKKGDLIAIVESDKASFEVEAEADGTLTHLLYEVGEEVEVFKPIAYIDGPDEIKLIDEESPSELDIQPSEEGMQKFSEEYTSEDGAVQLMRPRSSPAARRLAREKGIDLNRLKGTGHGGRIVFADVEEATQNRSDLPFIPVEKKQAQKLLDSEIKESDKVIPFTSIRKVIASRMSLSKQTIPHFYVYVDVDVTEIMRWRTKYNADKDGKVTVTDLIVKASAIGLREVPHLNAWVDEDRIVLKSEVNIGVATSIDEGLVVSVISRTDEKTLPEISVTIKKLINEAREGGFKPNRSCTFTVSSLGMYGVKGFFPIINPPQCAILAVGAIEKKVMPSGERDVMRLTLAADHRGVDGVQAASFLSRIRSLLEEHEKMISE